MAKKSTTKKKAGATPEARSRSTAQAIRTLEERSAYHSGLLDDLLDRIRDLEANSHRVEVEPWKPKVGDYVWITGPTAGGDLSLVNTLATVKIFFGEDDSVGTDKHSEWHPRSSYRKPSEEDITLYKQEEEARLKKEKEEIPFGKPVKWGAAPLFGEDLRAKAIYLGRCADGTYTIATEKHGGGFMQHNVKRDEFIIEP